MTKKVKALVLTGIILILSIQPTVLSAAEPPDKGVYIVGGFNGGGQNVSIAGFSAGNAGVGAQVMGGYHFSKYFAVEAGYSGLNFASTLNGSNLNYFTHEIMPRFVVKTNKKLDLYAFGGAGIIIAQYTLTRTGLQSAEERAPLREDRAYSGFAGSGGGGLLYHWGKGWFAGPEGSLSYYSYNIESVGVGSVRYLATIRIGYEWPLK